MGELDAIPAPPRQVRRGAAFRYRWLLGVLGLALVLASLLGFVAFGSVGIDLLPLSDDALDAECAFATGMVTAVEDSGVNEKAGRIQRIRYRFEAGLEEPVEGASFAAHDARFAVGEPCEVEYLPHAPEVSRVRGTRRNPLGIAWSLFVGAGFLPAVLLTLLWVRGAMQTRLLLSTGRVTLARVLEQHPIPGVNPPQRRIRYEFSDDRGRTFAGSHWVGLRTPLGARLEREVENIPVVYDSHRPQRSRLVHRSDFLS